MMHNIYEPLSWKVKEKWYNFDRVKYVYEPLKQTVTCSEIGQACIW